MLSAATISLLLLTACNDRSGQELIDAIRPDTDTTAQVLPMDSLRQLYQQLLGTRSDSLPLHLIREEGKLYPVDEAPRDTAFFVFREKLKQALDRRDVFHLMDIIHPDIKVSFGGEQGVADFVTVWELDKPERANQSQIWDALGRVLRNGGTFSNGGRTFIAPYIFSTWPDTYDAFEYGALTGSGVRLRTQPSLQSQTRKLVSYDVVQVLETSDQQETIGGETHPWYKIKLADETEGYVYGKFLASSIDYRAGFEQQNNGRWMMTFFVAGD